MLAASPKSYAALGRVLPPRRDEIDAARKQVRMPAGLSDEMTRILRPSAAYRWLFPSLGSITPTYIEQVLRGAYMGGHVQAWQLFDLMEDTWPRLSKNLNELKRAVASLNWTVDPHAEQDEPPSDEAVEKAKVVNHALFQMRPNVASDENGFDDTVKDILDAWAKGFSVLEVLWDIRQVGQLGDITAPRATAWVRPDNYGWSPEGEMGLNPNVLASKEGAIETGPMGPRAYQPTAQVLGGNVGVIPFPENKFLIGINKAKSGHPVAGAMLRSLAWWWCAANFSADWLMNLAQVFGIPFRFANYPTGASDETISKVCNMLDKMGSAAWGAFPEGVIVNLESAGSLGEHSPQGDLQDRADKNCDLIILGQTLTSEVRQSGGNRALGQVHADVKTEVVVSAGKFVSKVFNEQLVPAILTLNYGEDSSDDKPTVSAGLQKEKDKLQEAQRFQIILASGIEIPKAWLYKELDIPLPQEGEETVKAPAPAAPKPGMEEPTKKPLPGEDKSKAATNAKAIRAKAKKVHPFTAAVASDLQPVLNRLAEIIKIDDPAIFGSKLRSFLDDIEELKRDILRDPASGRALEQAMAAAMTRGFQEGRR